MSRKPKGLQNTLQVRLYPTPEQSRLLMAHCIEHRIGHMCVLIADGWDTGMLWVRSTLAEGLALLVIGKVPQEHEARPWMGRLRRPRTVKR